MRDLPVRPGLLAIVLLSSLALTSPGWAKTAPAPGGTPPFKTVVYIPVEITLHMKDRAVARVLVEHDPQPATCGQGVSGDLPQPETGRMKRLVSRCEEVLRRAGGGGCGCNLLLRR